MYTKLNLSFSTFLIGLFLLAYMPSSIAQSKSYGKLIIENNGEMRLYDAVDFRINTVNTTKGIVGTERGSNKGFLSFMPGASWTNAANDAFIDGYVKTYQSGAFVFPIGDNSQFRPAKISASSKSNPTEAAYYGVNPSTAVTSPFFGTTIMVLPAGGPFNITQVETSIARVSNKEYWDINGTTSTKISLSWNPASAISALTTGILTNLVIVGWDGTKWREIPSTIDVFSMYGMSSNINLGSITTNANIVPNSYSVYTLASIFPDKKSVFNTKINNKIISQNQSLATLFSFNPTINDTNIVVTITQSIPMFGAITNATKNGYTYTANNTHIGIDSILSIATILNKPSGIIAYDTFVSEIIVLYQKADTNIDMGSRTSITLGKPFLKTQNLGYKYNFKSKHGIVDQFNTGTFRYQSSKFNLIDTLDIYFEVNYLGILTTIDTTRYILKLASGINSINSIQDEKLKIQNYITPNSDGSNDLWVLPSELSSIHPKIEVVIMNIEGKQIYQSEKYQNDWPIRNEITDGIYLYQIILDGNIEYKGVLRINAK
jgi:gliding motility-associated-like protein